MNNTRDAFDMLEEFMLRRKAVLAPGVLYYVVLRCFRVLDPPTSRCPTKNSISRDGDLLDDGVCYGLASGSGRREVPLTFLAVDDRPLYAIVEPEESFVHR